MTYQLALITHPQSNEPWDFERVAAYVGECAPDVSATVLDDRRGAWKAIAAEIRNPMMTFSPLPLRLFQPPHGPVFQGVALGKSAEYLALERAGIAVPRWQLLTRTRTPDLSPFGPYVVMKPDRGGRGADVKIVRTGRVRWRAPETHLAAALGGACDWIVQEFVYTGPRPVSHRVATLFGEPLWAWSVEAAGDRRELKHRYDFRGQADGGGMSIVSSGRGCVFRVLRDAQVFTLARAAHRAFPAVPLLGVDVLRDAETGRLFVIEVNAVGLTWHLTSPVGLRIQREFAFDLEAEFGVRRTAARVLADRTRRYAR